MPVMDLHLEGEGAWPDLHAKEVTMTDQFNLAALKGGMTSGKPSVALRFDLPDGSVLIAETSLAIFLTAADALKAKFGDPR